MTEEPAGVPAKRASEETRNVRWFNEVNDFDVEEYFYELVVKRSRGEQALIGHWFESYQQNSQLIPTHKFFVGMRAPVIGLKPTWMWFYIYTDIIVTKKDLEGQVTNAIEQIRNARAQFIQASNNGPKKGPRR